MGAVVTSGQAAAARRQPERGKQQMLPCGASSRLLWQFRRACYVVTAILVLSPQHQGKGRTSRRLLRSS